VVELILEYISIFLALMLVLSIHEFTHAFTAVKCGDMTPKAMGRYTINPFAHFNLLGLISFVLVGFGWAKPVPINPSNFKRYKRGCFFTSIAGVVANYLLAFLVYPLFALVVLYVPQFGYFTFVLQSALRYVVIFSLSFIVFNLLPIYPLDGFRAIDVFCKKRGKFYWFLRSKGIFILLGLFALSFIADLTGVWFFDIFGIFMDYAVRFIGYPIIKFWGLVF
jgi:Zn-dependent protease